jgi:hypothetical protein
VSLKSRVLDKVIWKGAVADRCGFVLPVIVFGLMLMGTMTVAALLTAGDEARSGRAMREATGAFYAAEAGLNWVYANWDTVKADVDTLSGGSSFDLGWRSLYNGDSYRAVIHRWDEGAQPIYQLVVDGRSGGELGSQKRLSYSLTAAAGGGGEAYKLGECCDAAATIRGDVAATHAGTTIDGHDEHPVGCGTGSIMSGFCYDWTTAGVCSDSLYDKPAFIMQDTSLFLTDGDAALDGNPVLMQDNTIGDQTFHQFGDLTWDEIKAMADHVLGAPGAETELTGEIYPRYTVDPMTGELLCDKSHPHNWGSPDPNDPCFDYFPIIVARGNFAMEASYGQAVVILDYDHATMTGSEFELEDDAIFNGLILGKGCVEIQYEAQFHGALFVDGLYTNDLCGVDKVFDLNKTGHTNYSQCAIDRAMVSSGLAEYAEPQVPGESGGVQFLVSHSFGEGFR